MKLVMSYVLVGSANLTKSTEICYFCAMEVVLGIDIGGTYTKLGLVDKMGDILYEDEVRTTGHDTIEAFIETLH